MNENRLVVLVLSALALLSCREPRPGDGDAEPDSGEDADTDGAEDADGDTESGGDCQVPDRDGDGHASLECGGEDCDDDDAAVHPGVVEDRGWTVDVVASGEEAGRDPSLAVMPAHAPSAGMLVALHGAGTGEPSLEVAHLDGGTWAQVGYWTQYVRSTKASLALGPGGDEHVAWEGLDSYGDSTIRYASNLTGTWRAEDLDDHHWNSLQYPAIGVCATDDDPQALTLASVFYLDTGILGSTIMQHDVGGVAASFQGSIGDVGQGSGLAVAYLSAECQRHVVLSARQSRDAPTVDLIHVHGSGASAQVEIVDTDVGPIRQPALGWDAAGSLHVAYVGQGLHPRHAARSDGVWQVEVVDEADEALGSPAIAVTEAPGGGQVAVHVAYVEAASGELRYGNTLGGAWRLMTVPTDDGLGGDVAIAVDAAGGVHILASEGGGWRYLLDVHIGLAPDGVDNDCDGVVDLACGGAGELDADGDGHGAAACGGDDCNDSWSAVHPAADEVACDGVDQDCDGADVTDNDGDGYECPRVGGDDCDDGDATINPGAAEIWYDGIDQDCSGGGDDDADGDGRTGDMDCDDTDPTVYWYAEEIPCDGIDQDCSGSDVTDADGDGWECPGAGGSDCNDDDESISPGAVEVACDGVDQDCDLADLVDFDGDGHLCPAAGGDDCDDAASSVYPGADEVACDDIDQDCDGADAGADVDLDGFECHVDCDDAAAGVYPGAPGDDWDPSIETVERDAYLQANPSIAIDGAGALWVSYHDWTALTDDVVRVATNASGAWVDEPIEQPAETSALALDRSGFAHLVTREAGGQLDYATNASGAWVAETADGLVADWINTFEIVIDDLGDAHVAYVDQATSDLRLATNASGAWVGETIDTRTGWRAIALVLDAAGALHLGYESDGLRYATNASGAWVIDDSLDRRDGIGGISMAIDEGGFIHIGYVVSSFVGDGEVDHLTNASGLWVSEVVDTDHMGGNFADLRVGPGNVLHFAYEQRDDATANRLRYGRYGAGGWQVGTVEGDDAGSNVSMAIDASGAAHLVYSYTDDDVGSILYYLHHTTIIEPSDGVDQNCDGIVW
jgi:hypothetical protein